MNPIPIAALGPAIAVELGSENVDRDVAAQAALPRAVNVARSARAGGGEGAGGQLTPLSLRS
jgi:hypothetical protein